MREQKHQVLFLAGLGDERSKQKIKLVTRHWLQNGVDVYVHNCQWQDNTTELKETLNELEQKIKKLSTRGPVTIIGCSAGGSLAMNIFLKHHQLIEKVVSICGRLRSGQNKIRSLNRASKNSQKFRESVLMFENSEVNVPEELKKRMLTLSAKFGDQIVPSDTSSMAGVRHIKIPSFEHNLSITLALTLFKKPIINFINLD